MSRKTKRHERSGVLSPRLIQRSASEPFASWNSIRRTIGAKLRLWHVLRTAKHERITEPALNALVDAFPMQSRLVGLSPLAYAGVPERCLVRDWAGVVRMVVIGGLG